MSEPERMEIPPKTRGLVEVAVALAAEEVEVVEAAKTVEVGTIAVGQVEMVVVGPPETRIATAVSEPALCALSVLRL